MERLTEKTIGCFEYDLAQFKHVPREFNNYDAFFAYNMAVRKLGKYEETGLEPEEVKQLKSDYDRLNDFEQSQCAKLLENVAELRGRLKHYEDLEEQGRLVELQFVPKEPLYGVLGMACSAMWVEKMYAVSVEIHTDGVITFDTTGDFCGERTYLVGDIGKRIFLTREEAEEALEKMKNK